MLIKNTLNKLIIFCLAIILLLAALPSHSFASSKTNGQAFPNKRHLRGAWISTTLNLDWPSSQAKNTKNDNERIQKSKDELIGKLDRAVDLNINAVFFQVSPEGDAFYESDIVPWSRYLTGTFGKDPGFDPLEFAIEEAHKRNLELHAWFNPYRVSMNTSDATISSLNIEKSVYKEHPDWIGTTHSRFVVDPGVPEAREWVKDRVMEVVENYDIDGIHFDDYFYYEADKWELDDQSSYEKYGSGFSNKGDWRRNNTYLLIKELNNKIGAKKPWVKFGVSPAAVWANQKDGYPNGSDTNAGLPNYNRSFADTKKWVEEEIIDYIAPQVYFSFTNPHVPYGEIINWWADLVKGKDVHLYIGQALYKVNVDSDPSFKGNAAVTEFTNQHHFNIKNPEVMGSIMFRFNFFNSTATKDVISKIQNDLWASKALVPLMDWKGGQAPQSPINGKIEATSAGSKLTWTDNDPNTAYYAIYRTQKDKHIDINSDESAGQLIATLRKSNGSFQEFIDKEHNHPDEVTYAVTALDRLHHESDKLTIDIRQSKYFADVNRGQAWAIDAIDYLYENGVIEGKSPGRFSPLENIRRADLLIMAMRFYDIELDSNISDNFSDASQNYFTPYLGTAKRLGIVEGYSGNLFQPRRTITRQDMFVIIYRIMDDLGKVPPIDGVKGKSFEDFSDKDQVGSHAREAVKYFIEAGIVEGRNGKITPLGYARRAEVAQVFYNIVNIMK